MTTPRTLRVKCPADLLACVPQLLGFHPEDSLVLLTVGSEAERFHARADLPENPAEVCDVVGMLRDAVVRNRVTQVVVVVYSDDHCLALEASAALRRALEDEGVSLSAAVRADGQRWYPLVDRTEDWDPTEGGTYDVTSHPWTAQSVLDGQVVLGSRRELADSLVGSDPDAITAVDEAVQEAMTRLRAAARHQSAQVALEQARRHLVDEGRWVRDRLSRYLEDARSLDAEDAGRMLVAMVAIDVRDVAWAEITRANAGQHVHLWRDMVQRSPYDFMAAPAALLGFAAWLSGDGALAWCAVDRCQEVDPDYRLATLLSAALSQAVPPSAWRPIERSDLTLFTG